MAFGDIIQNPGSAKSNSATSIAQTFASAPTSGNLLSCYHGTGHSSRSNDAAYVEDLLIDNTVNGDVQGIDSREATGSDSLTVTCTTSASDEQFISIVEFEGPIPASRVDVAEATARQASGTSYTVSSVASRAQNSEIGIIGFYTRDPANDPHTLTNYTSLNTDSTTFKSWEHMYRVYTTTGTVSEGISYSNSDPAMGGVVTYKEDTGGAVEVGNLLSLLGVG